MSKLMTVSEQLLKSQDFDVKNGNTILIPNNLVKAYLSYNYGAFYCNDLYGKFIYHNLMCAADLEKALAAWNATYDPLHNYDGSETVINLKSKGNEKTTESNTKTNNLTSQTTNNLSDTITHNTTDTLTNATTDTNTFNTTETKTLTPDSIDNYTTSTATDGTKTTEYSTSYDTENLKKTSESVPTGGTKTEYHLKTTDETRKTGTETLGKTGTETTTKTGTETNTKTGTQTTTDTGTVGDNGNNETEYKTTSITKDGVTYTAHEIEINELEKGGNLGVTTSQQMIQSEVDMRLNPVTMQYLNKFAMMYFWYVGGDF